MSGPTIVVLPASGSGTGTQHHDQDSADIASTVQNALYERANPQPEHPGPFKQMLAQTDSLYKYISWEDPIRTLTIYIGALSVLFGAHYLPLTQLALKAGVTALGVVSVGEFASRSLSANSLSARLRPKEYKTIPESTLNATLKDVHDFIQYAVVQAQRVVFGQDLEKTFAAFLSCTALFWLAKVLPAFWLLVMGLTSIFVAPLISSFQGREAVHNASVRAQELATTAAEKGKVLAQDGRAKAGELSSKGMQAASDLSTQARDTASNMSATVAENARKLPQMGVNASNKASNTVHSAVDDAQGRMNNPSSNSTNSNYNGNRSATDEAANRESRLSNSDHQTTKQMAPEFNAGKQFESYYTQDEAPASRVQIGSKRTDSVADASFTHPAAGDAYVPQNFVERPRGASQAGMNGVNDIR